MNLNIKREAFALAIVLWIVVALLLGSAFIAYMARGELDLSAKLNDKLISKLEANSIFEKLKYYIMSANFDFTSLIATPETKEALGDFPAKIVVDGRWYKIKNGYFSIRDLSSMVGLYHPNSEIVARLLANGDDMRYHTIRDSLLDWIDRDNFVHLNGAEESFYRLEKDVVYRPRNNFAIQSVDELRLVRGVDTISKAKWQELKKELYWKVNRYPYNLFLIDDKLLKLLFNLNFLELDNLKRWKQEEPRKFSSYLEHNKNFDDRIMGFALSFSFHIKVVSNIDGAESEIDAIIDFRGSNNRVIIYRYNAI